MDIDALLENWQVHPPGMWTNNQGPEGWWAVSNEREGIVAYFLKERDAFRYRLHAVNRVLNG